MFNPNQTKSVFWLIVIIAVIALAIAGVCYYKKQQNTVTEDTEATVVANDTEKKN